MCDLPHALGHGNMEMKETHNQAKEKTKTLT